MRNRCIGDLLKLPGYDPKVIVDVGANVGQSALEFIQHFCPDAVHSLEPIRAAFDQLALLTEPHPVVRPHHLALSDHDGHLTMTSNAASTGNRVLGSAERARGEVERVVVTTGDAFCLTNGIERIDLLKIDAEGHDLSVLVGFTAMLRTWSIDVLQVECGLSPENDIHVPMEAFTHFLSPLGYRLFGLYGISRRLHRLPHTRQAMYGDAVYVANPARPWVAA